IIIPLIAGLLLDTLIGDPRWLPHPIRLFGKAIAAMERQFNKGSGKKLKGFFIAIFLVIVTGAVFLAIIVFVGEYPVIYYPVASVFVFYGLANRSLIDEALKVNRKLNNEGLLSGREQLSQIVGRETSELSENQVRSAVLETLSENLSDGVIAPLFYYFIGGIPLMFAYKMVNTLDSMIGYKNDKYKKFGFFAAKLDDVLNYIPARITAFLIALAGFSGRALQFIRRYGNKHSSPNAGYPEAALAGVLNCRFGGPNYYHNQLVNKPYIGAYEKNLGNKDLFKTIKINILVALIFSMLCILLLNAIS
ncbi:MAG: adenosylcobinamide-phosphate synthase CbiB, partial [Bacteroidota bacterium]